MERLMRLKVLFVSLLAFVFLVGCTSEKEPVKEER